MPPLCINGQSLRAFVCVRVRVCVCVHMGVEECFGLEEVGLVAELFEGF